MAEKPRQNLFENATDYIRSQILSGEFAPGSHITEASIAKVLKTSRGPILEALKSLESEGMVNYETNKGYTVVFLSPRESWEVFFLRGQLEKIAIEAAGGGIAVPLLMEMEHALHQMEVAQKKRDANGLVGGDEAFHMAIVENSGVKHLAMLWKNLSPLNIAMFYSGNRASVFDIFVNQWETHVTLYDILRQGNLEKSTEAVLNHYLSPGKRIYQGNL